MLQQALATGVRGMRAEWAEFGELRVVDGDDVVWRGVRYRLEGYDAPEVHKGRSKIDRALERKRGLKAMFRLVCLIRGARNVVILPKGEAIARERQLGMLMVNLWDVSDIARRERWGCPYPDRQRTDWGDQHTPFPDDLPLPDGYIDQDAR